MDRIITYNLSENFIEKLAEFISENFLKQNKDISRLAFVFGGKRPSLFLKRELSSRIKKSFYPPAFFSVDEFIEFVLLKKEAFTKISELDAAYIIYNLAKTIAPDILKYRESFALFLPWAKEILGFIEQLDLEDIEIKSLKDIEFKADIGYDVPDNINSLLGSIISLRDAYHLALKEKKTYSRGLIYLLASQYIKDAKFDEFDRILFCDLFHLHKTEENIIKNIYDKNNAIIFFQGNRKEWPILDKLSKQFNVSLEPEQIIEPQFKLSVYAGFDVHSQACMAREILKKIKNPDKTVIVLPEPDNVVPLLSEISSHIDDFNVSMGYPLKRSSLCLLFELIFKAQETKKQNEYYVKDYLKILSHPLIKNLNITENSSITRILVHKIEEILLGMKTTSLGGSLFVRLSDIENLDDLYNFALDDMRKMEINVNRDDIKDILMQLHKFLFNSWDKISSFYEFSCCLKDFLDVLARGSLIDLYPINLKIIDSVFFIQEELKTSVFKKEPFLKHDIFKIFKNKLESEMISFSGFPLKSLQVLGLFETRSLSFENVIVMDANESFLPKLKVYEPLVPRDVMLSLGLNRLEKEDEIQRYQFMRLISSAKNVHLIYKESKAMEKSRYIEELIWKYQKKLKAIDVLPVSHASFNVNVLPKNIEIKKDSKLIEFLENHTYSATSVNMYLNCPLRFYYQYALGLEEKEDILDEPEGADIGKFIHELLEETFRRFAGKQPVIDSGFKDDFFKILNKKFEEEFQKKMKTDSFITKKILEFRLNKFLDNEKERNVKEILCLEKILKGEISFAGKNFRFKVIIDRIDKLNDDSILVIDYKSGSSDSVPSVKNIKKDISYTRDFIKKNIKSFQLPLYLYFTQNIHKDAVVNAALYHLRYIEEKNYGLNLLINEENFSQKNEIMDIFKKALEFVMCEILNPDVTFKADDKDYIQCGYCQFFYLCR